MFLIQIPDRASAGIISDKAYMVLCMLQIPAGGHKTELVSFMDRIPVFCQQINQTIRAQTVGKAATFSKVCDATINLM